MIGLYASISYVNTVGNMRGRKSLADIILEEVEVKVKKDKRGKYIVVYDFSCERGNIPNRFYSNLDKLRAKLYFESVQKSVVLAYSLKSAYAIALLAKHYGANVRIYKIEKEIDLSNLIDTLIDTHVYYKALQRAWREYWGNVEPWYASIENMMSLINEKLSEILGRHVTMSLEEHLKYIKELARWGKIEYRYGGIDPKRKHWILVREVN